MGKGLIKCKWIGLLFCIVLISFKSIAQILPPLSVKQDTLEISKDSVSLPYTFNNSKDGKLFLSLPSSKEIIYDAVLQQYMIIEKIGVSDSDWFTGVIIFINNDVLLKILYRKKFNFYQNTEMKLG